MRRRRSLGSRRLTGDSLSRRALLTRNTAALTRLLRSSLEVPGPSPRSLAQTPSSARSRWAQFLEYAPATYSGAHMDLNIYIRSL